MTQLPMYVLLDFQKSLKEVSVVDGMVYTHPPTHTHTHTHRAIPSKGKFVNYRRRTITKLKLYLEVSPVHSL